MRALLLLLCFLRSQPFRMGSKRFVSTASTRFQGIQMTSTLPEIHQASQVPPLSSVASSTADKILEKHKLTDTSTLTYEPVTEIFLAIKYDIFDKVFAHFLFVVVVSFSGASFCEGIRFKGQQIVEVFARRQRCKFSRYEYDHYNSKVHVLGNLEWVSNRYYSVF